MTNGWWPGVAPIGTTLLWVRFTYPHLYTLMLTDSDPNTGRIRTTGPNSRALAFQILQARTFRRSSGTRTSEDLLAGLLAIIHRDCGHHTHTVGFEQSTNDAIKTVLQFQNGTHPPLPALQPKPLAPDIDFKTQRRQALIALRVFQERLANSEDPEKLTVHFPLQLPAPDEPEKEGNQ